ncbi:MAG: hypothetical protein CMK59_12335 [Proteobacteria bacterium]|nr:hypothetical protein [Pseudomonadota bacterium]
MYWFALSCAQIPSSWQEAHQLSKQAEMAFEKEAYEEASELYKRASILDPQSETLKLLWKEALIRSGSGTSVIASIEEALRRSPGDEKQRYLSALFYCSNVDHIKCGEDLIALSMHRNVQLSFLLKEPLFEHNEMFLNFIGADAEEVISWASPSSVVSHEDLLLELSLNLSSELISSVVDLPDEFKLKSVVVVKQGSHSKGWHQKMLFSLKPNGVGETQIPEIKVREERGQWHRVHSDSLEIIQTIEHTVSNNVYVNKLFFFSQELQTEDVPNGWSLSSAACDGTQFVLREEGVEVWKSWLCSL